MATATGQTATLVAAAITRAERTQKWVASKSGIPLTTFRRKVGGFTDFTVSEILAVAAALEVEPATLLPESFGIRKVA